MFKNRSLNNFARYALIISVISISFLFSPRPGPDEDICAKYMPLGTHAGFMLNCDAAVFCMSAAEPAMLLDSGAVRQSRPLYVLAATAIGFPIQAVLGRLNVPIFHALGDRGTPYIGYYIAYVLMNIALLMLTLYLFEYIIKKLTGNDINKWLLYAFSMFLVSNQLTKAFFWTAHQQFFAMFTPLFTIYLYLMIQEKGWALQNKRIGWLSFMTGILMLCYGNFAPMFACIQVAAWSTNRKIAIPAIIKNTVLFLLPSLSWVAICTIKNGHYYNSEIEKFHQLMWIPASLHMSFSQFCSMFFGLIIAYLKTFAEPSFFIFAAIVLAMITKSTKSFQKQALYPFYISFLVYFLFLFVLGYYKQRLTFTLFPFLICILLLQVNSIKSIRNKPYIFYLIVLGWHLYNVLSYGPFD